MIKTESKDSNFVEEYREVATRVVQWLLCNQKNPDTTQRHLIFYSHFKPSHPGNLAKRSSVKHYLLSVPLACSAPLDCAQLLLYTCHVHACYC